MKIKKGVILAGLQIEMRPVLKAANQIWQLHQDELVITAGLEGEHSAGSLHYYGYALDLRTRNFSKSVQKQIVVRLKERLGPDYDVILHSTHMHVEYDKAKEVK